MERIPVPVLLTAAALAALMVGLSGCDPVIIHVSDYRPRFGSEVMDRSYAAGAAIKSQTLPSATGGTPPLVYTLSSVPGLTFDPDTRTLTGTPTQIGRYRLTYRVTDADGDMDFLSFKVTVAGTLKFASSVEDQEFETGVEIEPLHLPATTGGTPPLAYTLSPEVPGLAFNPHTRTLTGTPADVGTYDATYVATDSDGATGVLRFTISVGSRYS